MRGKPAAPVICATALALTASVSSSPDTPSVPAPAAAPDTVFRASQLTPQSLQRLARLDRPAVKKKRPRTVRVRRYVAVSRRGEPTEAQWRALRDCESGGDYGVVADNGHYGAYQFSIGTWRSVGGSGSPAEASHAEQDYRALLLWRSRGWQPWACAWAAERAA